MTSSSPGRNDPCPCGSGRKFKHCHLGEQGSEDAARVRLRMSEGRLIPALFVYAADEWGEEFVDEAWEEFFLWDRAPTVPEESREFGTTFDPFLAFSFVRDPAAEDLPADWPDEPVAEHFLRRNGPSLPASDREFIVAACRSHPSFFVVEAVVAGRSVDLKDILTGWQVRVLEQSASRTFRPGDVTYTRVVTAGGASIMIGASAWVIPASWHTRIIDFRGELPVRGFLRRDDLAEYDIEVRELYDEIAERLAHPRLPQLQNTDGDPLEMTTMTYELAVGAPEAIERLVPLATMGDERHVSHEAFDEAGVLTSAVLSWMKAGNRQHKDWDNTVLGTIRIDGATLVVDVNSARRRDRIKKEIQKRLGDTARLVATTVTDVAEAMARHRARGTGPDDVDADPIEIERTPEIEAMEAEMARRHWEAWMDMKVPALGNKTPRQSAKSVAGRERLEALLMEYAQRGEQAPSAFRPDVPELRRRLGLG